MLLRKIRILTLTLSWQRLGYDEEGNITTPFDMRVQNEIDRFHLVMAALKEIPRYKNSSKLLEDWCLEMLEQHKKYIHEYGEDLPYIKEWKWEEII